MRGVAPTTDVLINIGRRNVEGGGRLDDLRHTSFRGVVGLRGDLAAAGVFCNGNTFPQVYDTLGRFVFLGLTADL